MFAKNACSSGTYSPVYCRNGSRLCSTGRRFSSTGTVSLSDFLMSGRPVLAAFVSGPSAVRKLLNSGANGLAACSSAASWRSVGLEFLEVRVGDRGELVDFFEAPTLELCSNVGSARNACGERLAGFGGRVEGALAVDDRAFELVVAAGERVEDHARVVHERFDRAFLGVEQRHELVGAFDERFEAGRSRR